MARRFGVTRHLAATLSVCAASVCAQTVDEKACSELEGALTLAERYATVFSRFGEPEKHLGMIERAVFLKRSMRESGCGDVDSVRSDRASLLFAWRQDSAGRDWDVLGDTDNGIRLHFIVSIRSGDAISAWIILNRPGPIPQGHSTPTYKSSAELIVTGCTGDAYLSRGLVLFGGGSATGEATAHVPYGRPRMTSLQPQSLLAKIGRLACEADLPSASSSNR